MPLILLVTANSQTTPLQLAEEVRRVRGALGDGTNFTVIHESEIRVEDLIRRLLDERPDILHFAGHGAGQEDRGIAVKDDRGGQTILSDKLLVEIIDAMPSPPKLVVLNACYSSGLSKALEKKVKVVVGASGAIADSVAHRFAAQFYAGVGRSLPVCKAISLAKIELEVNGIDPRIIQVRCQSPDDLKMVFPARPQLMARFRISRQGVPEEENGHYPLVIWMRGIDQHISSVTYQICHESFAQRFWEVTREEANDFWSDGLRTMGDITIRATAWARDRGVGVGDTLVAALRRHYGENPEPAIIAAIENLASN